MWKDRSVTLNFWSLCALACFPVLSLKITPVLIILFSALCIAAGLIAGKPEQGAVRFRELWLLLLPFVLIFFRTFIVERSEDSMFYLEVSLSLLAFPLAFYISPLRFDRRRRSVVHAFFAASTAAICLYGIVRTIARMSAYVGAGKYWPTVSQLFTDPSFSYHLRTQFEVFTGIHPTYACVFLGISVLFCVEEYFSGNLKKRKLLVGGTVLLLLTEATLASRTPFIATLIAGTVLILLHTGKKVYLVYAAGLIVAGSVLLFFFVPSFSSRFSEISIDNAGLPTERSENSFNIRTGIYKCSMEIIGDHWLWGVGPGHVQDQLNHCYESLSKEVYGNKNYNTHNQFLDYWLGLGILGPLALLAIFIYSSVKNFRNGNLLVPALSVFFAIAFLTENLLTRQNGIVCFALFMSWYFFSGNETRDEA